MKKISIFTVLSLCAVLFAATSAMAFGEIRYPDRPLNLRASRSASASWVGSLYPGQKVRIAYIVDGWAAVFEPGETRNTEDAAVGFSNVKYLKTEQTRVEPKPWGELVYTTRKLNIRSTSSTKGKKLDMLEVNERVRIDFPDDDWAMVFRPGATIRSKLNARGFCNTKFFVPVAEGDVPTAEATVEKAVEAPRQSAAVTVPSVQKPEPVAKPAPEKMQSTAWGRVLVVPRAVNLRQARTSSSKLLKTLRPGDEVRVDFLKNGWLAVFDVNEPLRRENKAMGYVLESLLAEDSGSTVAALGGVSATDSSAPARKPAAAAQTAQSAKKTLVIDKNRFKNGKRPDPTPDKMAHGYQYRLLEKSEMKRFGETWIQLKVFLSTSVLPGEDALNDFAETLWREHKRVSRNLAVMIFLPGMDTEDLAYGVIQFSDEERIESWFRKTTLFGTDFL